MTRREDKIISKFVENQIHEGGHLLRDEKGNVVTPKAMYERIKSEDEQPKDER